MATLRAILFLLLLAVRLPGEDLPLMQLVEELRADFRWEPYRKIGTLARGDTKVTFRLSSDSLVINHVEEKRAGKIELKNGALYASEAVAAFLRELFTTTIEGPTISWVVIDPGHGGKDPGTNHSHTVDGNTIRLVEKEIVLFVSKELQALLAARFPDKNIILTRSDDTYLKLEERVEIANRIELESEFESIVFISVHANASLNPATYGYEVWYLPPEYGRGNLLAENLAGIETEELRQILNTMKDEEFTVESVLLARSILNGFDSTIGGLSKNLGLKEESWFVVRNAKMPSVLVELGFVTNVAEARLMADTAHLRKMAVGLYNGVTAFIEGFEGSNLP
ncbi:MAG: N-acetylmuramoyl-L-alanine amidase [Spirochaetales bacterium]|nr:N-acetylmuramoyl-L-alanine amidase [Spirochaetales bacterium]